MDNAELDFSYIKIQAFVGGDKDQSKVNFGNTKDCVNATVSDIVPIAVGGALAGLVIIVLIAYFIGRRRNRRLAYQSV